MNCDEAQDNMIPYLLEELGSDLVRGIEQHVADCATCQAELEELRSCIDVVADGLMESGSVPATERQAHDAELDRSANIMQAVMERVRTEAQAPEGTRVTAAPPSSPLRGNTVTRTFVYSCIAFAAGVLLMVSLRSTLFPQGMNALSKAGPPNSAEQPVPGPGVLPELGSVRLTTIDSSFQGEGVLQLLYDFASGELHVFCGSLDVPPEGKAYVLVCESEVADPAGSPTAAPSAPRSKSRQLCRIVPDQSGFGQAVVPRLSRTEARTARVILLAEPQIHSEL